MKELMKKLLEAGKLDALNSLEELTAAAKELGYTEQEIQKALEDFDGFPLDDDALEEITGGDAISRPPNVYEIICRVCGQRWDLLQIRYPKCPRCGAPLHLSKGAGVDY